MSKTSIPENVKRLLWIRAAGRCEFEGCYKILYEGDITKEYGNFGELCHVIGDSPNGPRGGEKSESLAKDIKNIVLMCPACHKIIDSDTKKYTIEIVEGMKKRHEDRIRLVTGIAHDKKSHVVTYYSKIGKHLPDFSFNTISSVLFPDYFPEASTAIEISMKGNAIKDSDPNFWEIEDKNLQAAFDYEVKQRIQHSETKHISLFPFADMPLLVRLGTLFNDIRELKIYQPHRNTRKWEWQRSGDENIEFKIIEPTDKSKQPVLVFALSATAITERIKALYSSQEVSIWTVTCTNPNNDFLKTEAKLKEFTNITREVLDKIKASSADYNEILVHMAMPVACAFTLGHVGMPKADMKLVLYDYYNNTENKTITIE
ncbi:SAVED domain-containing protein [Butyricimonas hominis]|uniref:SAVED domain-containing protein n=1 Tax=Butyricimonas TaxID=574697 RepID=UPI0035121627